MMRRIHLEHMENRGHREAVAIRQERRMNIIYELCGIRHHDFIRMTIECVQRDT